MRIPGKIKIGGIIYKIKIVDDMKDKAGEYDSSKQTIFICKAKQGSMEVTLLHEILHAINNEMGEVETEFLAQALYQVIKENPKIFQGGEAK